MDRQSQRRRIKHLKKASTQHFSIANSTSIVVSPRHSCWRRSTMMNELKATDKPHKGDHSRIWQGQEVRAYVARLRWPGTRKHLWPLGQTSLADPSKRERILTPSRSWHHSFRGRELKQKEGKESIHINATSEIVSMIRKLIEASSPPS